ncbi:MAG: 1-acyl-sn-glycerol-3-phosphate acyltransferase [Actinobacteria bacterium]|nr:1-acyl-sn-glycerol-3-phosphate acyltransferase [Actinomycetota bacterium]
MKKQVYIDPRGTQAMAKYHRRVRENKPSVMYDAVRFTTTGIYGALDRVTSIDPQNVPASGGVILVPNHFSFIDHFYCGICLRRKIQFMGKSQLFKPPMDFVFSHGGVFPVMRGKGDDEAFASARAIVQRGGVVQLYAEGGRSRNYYPKTAKRGPGILALTTGVPVVPIAIYGSQFLRDYKRHGFPKVTVQYGRPLIFDKIEEPTREQQIEAARTIFSRVTEMFYELDAKLEPAWRRRERERTGELPGNVAARAVVESPDDEDDQS